jgi:hypothetical protein
VSTERTAVTETPNSLAIGNMISKKMVKSKSSSIQPSHATYRSFVGSFHHGID